MTLEKCVLIGIITSNDDESKVTEYLEELEFLAETAGAVCVKKSLFKKWKNPITRLMWEKEKLRKSKIYNR
jgi:GTP-binding protein HflX